MGFEDRTVLGRQMTKDLGNASVLTRLGQLKRAIDCGCHGHAASTSSAEKRISDVTYAWR